MEFIVIQKPVSKITQPGRHIQFNLKKNTSVYDIAIEEDDKRKITILSKDSPTYPELFQVYYDIERLLMIFEGQFHSIEKAYENGIEITDSFRKRALESYTSAYFMINESNVLLDFTQFLNQIILVEWRKLQDNLELIHKMYLYCVSDISMPIDMKCAFMIEAFLGIAELLKNRKHIKLPRIGKDESKLGWYLHEIINTYGSDIFCEEVDNLDEFIKILVDSRNRIAHIKTRQGKVVLNGEQSQIYIMKLSLLYRKIMFELLGVTYGSYSGNLQRQISLINNLSATKSFINKLNVKPSES